MDIWTAIRAGDLARVTELVGEPRPAHGGHPIMWAVEADRIDMVRVLIDPTVNVSALLTWAKTESMARFLVEELGADPNVLVYPYGHSPVMARVHAPAAFMYLLELYRPGRPHDEYVLSYTANPECFDALIRRGVEPVPHVKAAFMSHIRGGSSGRCGMVRHIATRYFHLINDCEVDLTDSDADVVRILIDAGVTLPKELPIVYGDNGDRSLMDLVSIEMAELLLQHGVRVGEGNIADIEASTLARVQLWHLGQHPLQLARREVELEVSRHLPPEIVPLVGSFIHV